MSKPIKRHEALKPISREHHYGLLLSWKIRQGIRHEVELDRIKRYVDWFWENHLLPHFEFEEKHMFTLLNDNNPLIKKALKQHRRIKKLCNTEEDLYRNLSLLEEELDHHIRFEERTLFQKIEEVATKEQLEIIQEAHQYLEMEDWEDEFWVKS